MTSARDGLEPRARHDYIGGGVGELLFEIRLSPGTHLLVAFGGLLAGCGGTLGIAWVWSSFL